MDPDWGDYWANARQMGRTRFLLLRGTMLGLIMFGLLIGVPRLFDMVESDGLPILSFCLFMLLGYLLAFALWWANERSYTKISETRLSETPEIKDDH